MKEEHADKIERESSDAPGSSHHALQEGLGSDLAESDEAKGAQEAVKLAKASSSAEAAA